MGKSRGGHGRGVRVSLGAPGHPDLVVVSFPVAQEGIDQLTEAERETVTLLLGGHSNAEIARRRRAAQRTVANQISSIFRKLGVSSRLELAARLAAG